MSDLALSNSGELKTASEFHDDYILYDIKHKSFECPFCCVGLVAKAIYIDGPQGKSPHFSCFPKNPHINDCDGYPLVDGKTVKNSNSRNKTKIGQEEFSFPEKLVSRSKSSQKQFISNLNNIPRGNTSEKVRERREKVGREVGSAKYTSSMIRSFASAHKEIIALVYKDAKDKNLSNEDRKKFLKKVLSQFPIELYGYKTNYQVAFQGTKYFSEYHKIWNGKGVVKKIHGNIIYIRSKQATEYSHDDKLEFYVSVEIPDDLEDSLKYHQTIIEKLREACENELTVRWYGYGLAKPVLDEKSLLLKIDKLDHLFVETISQST